MRKNRNTAGNKGYAIAGVPCFADTFVQGGSSVLRTNFSAKTPHHRKPPNRWQQAKQSFAHYETDYYIEISRTFKNYNI